MGGSRYRWMILLLSYVCMLGFAFTLQSLPPILTLIMGELNLTHTEAGLLMGLFALPTMLLATLAGFLSDRWGPFKTGVTSLILVIMGTSIFAVGRVFLYLGLGRAIAGVGAITISIVAARILSNWFRGHELGTAMGIFNTAMPVGAIICFTTFGRLGESLGWRVPIFVTVIIAVLGLASFLILYKPAPNLLQETAHDKEEKGAGFFPSLLRIGISMWLVGFCWMWFNATAISFSTFAPDFLVSKGYSIGCAGFLASLLMWGSLGLSPVIGRLLDKVNNNEVFIAVGGVVLATALYLLTRSINLFFPIIFISVAVAFVPTPVFSFPSKILAPKNLGLGFGVLSMTSGAGMFFGPYVAGFVRDKSGSYEMSFILLSIFALLVTLTALILRIKMKGD